jgi:site-specific DNA-adenine methylase
MIDSLRNEKIDRYMLPDTLGILNHKETYEMCKDIKFTSYDFSKAIDNLYTAGYNFKDMVIYIDSPYSGTTATYNTGWNESSDRLLLSRVKALHQEGVKIVMSNVFENRGVVNQWLIDWCEDNKTLFGVIEMKISYANSSFRKSDQKTKEVLIVSRDNSTKSIINTEIQLELDFGV